MEMILISMVLSMVLGALLYFFRNALFKGIFFLGILWFLWAIVSYIEKKEVNKEKIEEIEKITEIRQKY